MTAFEEAMNDYYAHFGAPYPYAVGIGFKGTPSAYVRADSAEGTEAIPEQEFRVGAGEVPVTPLVGDC